MKLGGGTRDSFDSIYEKLFPMLIRIVYRITGDMDASEDLCQEAFIRFYERRDAFPSEDQAKYWLIRVAKNLSYNHEKRKGRERRAYERVTQQPQRPEESGETSMLKKESQHMIQDALDTLPYKLRVVLVLKEYGGLDYKTIGSILGISEGNVKVRVFRARERLATIFQEGEVYVP
jgi:RNA polymerase sigma-70 factor (ECF subfamily)